MDAAARQGAMASRDAERIDLHHEGHALGSAVDELVHEATSEGDKRRDAVIQAGFEPATSTMSTWRELRFSTGSVPVGPAGVEPASHRLSGGGLAARSTARFVQMGRRESNPVRLVQSQTGYRYNTPQIKSIRRERDRDKESIPVSRILFYAIISLMHLPDHRRPAHRLRSIWLAPSEVVTILSPKAGLSLVKQ